LDWGFELESIILEILGEADEIPEEHLLNLLIPRPELQTLLASSVEFIQKIPELNKKHGGNIDFSRLTIKGELKVLIIDLTSGAYHKMYHSVYHDIYKNLDPKDPHRKLERKIVSYGNKPTRVFIKRITDEYNLR